MRISSVLVWVGTLIFAYHLGAIGGHEDIQRLKLQGCEEVWSMAPSGMLRFDGGLLTIPSETHCEALTVRGKRRRSPCAQNAAAAAVDLSGFHLLHS